MPEAVGAFVLVYGIASEGKAQYASAARRFDRVFSSNSWLQMFQYYSNAGARKGSFQQACLSYMFWQP